MQHVEVLSQSYAICLYIPDKYPLYCTFLFRLLPCGKTVSKTVVKQFWETSVEVIVQPLGKKRNKSWPDSISVFFLLVQCGLSNRRKYVYSDHQHKGLLHLANINDGIRFLFIRKDGIFHNLTVLKDSCGLCLMLGIR